MSKAASSLVLASLVIVALGLVVYPRIVERSPERPPPPVAPPTPPEASDADGSAAEPATPRVVRETKVTPEVAQSRPERPQVEEPSADPTAASLVRTLIRDPDAFMRDAGGLRALRSLGEDAVPELRRALRHAAPAVRGTACWTLELLGRDARAAVPDLVEALEDDSQRVQEQAAQALGALGAAAKDAIPILTELGKNYEVEPLNDIARVAVERIREALDERDNED